MEAMPRCAKAAKACMHLPFFYSPPSRAASSQVIKLLLSAGASPAVLDEDGQTALHHAASEGHVEALLVLAPSPECAELFVVDTYQMTPFHLACENGHDACVAHILALCEKQKGEANQQRAEQMRRGSALFLAQKNEHGAVVGLIEGSTPLAAAQEAARRYEASGAELAAAITAGPDEGGASGSGS